MHTDPPRRGKSCCVPFELLDVGWHEPLRCIPKFKPSTTVLTNKHSHYRDCQFPCKMFTGDDKLLANNGKVILISIYLQQF